MGKSTPPKLFKIHVDSSCLTDSTDLEMPAERNISNETVVHHESWSAGSPGKLSTEDHKEDEDEKKRAYEDDAETKQTNREQLDPRIEAQIQAAARRVVASLERDQYDGHEDSVLSMQTDESYEQEGTELTYDGTELTYDGTELTYDGTEGTYESENPHHSQHRDEEQLDDAHHCEHDEEEAKYESDVENHSHDQAMTRYEPNFDQPEHDPAGDSSSHHDGDSSDDVFSRNSGHSARSSLNSIHELDENYTQKPLTSPTLGEEAASSHPESEAVSRIPSGTSYVPQDELNLKTPSKVLNRPPFRTPSSVRAMQMSSPTPSLFSSPRSTKRHLPTVSRIGTPTSQYSPSKRTPTRFKKKELPLVLLHVTVLPLQWAYSHLMSSPDVPESLQGVKASWRFLHDKLGDTVLERGILLPHPQDSYEVLEERLLEALELPVRPRARILKCGHYMGPLDSETPSSDEESGNVEYFRRGPGTDRKWCDICGREVRLEDGGVMSKEGQRFRVKIYASNGLMRAGAWAAAWREMERVDVEIEPFVDVGLHAELEHLAATATIIQEMEPAQEHNDGFVDEEVNEHVHEEAARDEQRAIEEEEQRRAEEEIRMKMEEEEMSRKLAEEEEMQRKMEEDMRRKLMEEERIREIYGHTPQAPPVMEDPRSTSRMSRRSSSRHGIDEDSLAELLLAAFKVAMRDKRNIVICLLSALVLLLALKPREVVQNLPPVIMKDTVALPEVVTSFAGDPVVTLEQQITSSVEMLREMPSRVAEVAKEVEPEVPVVETPAIKEDEPMIEEVKPEPPVVETAETKEDKPVVEREQPNVDRPVVEIKDEEPIDEAEISQPAQKVVIPSLDPAIEELPAQAPVEASEMAEEIEVN